MGALYEALTGNQNLAPVADAIKGYVQKKKDEEKLQNFLRLMEQNKQKVNDLYKAPDETTYQTAPVPQNNFLNRLRKDGIGQPQQGMNLDINVPQDQIVPNTQPKPFRLQDIGQVTTGTKPGKLTIEQLRNADKEANNLVIDTLMQGARNQLTPEQQQQAVNMIQLIKQGNQPTKQNYHTVGDGQDLVSIDDYGKVNPVYQNTKEANRNPQYQWHKIGEGTEKGIEYAVEENILTGEQRKVKLGDAKKTGTSITVNNKDTKESKWNEVADLITKVQNPFYISKETGKPTPLTPEEQKSDSDQLYNTAVGKLIPSAKLWYDRNIKKKWGREDLSQEDFLAEIEDGITPDPKTGRRELSEEAATDLMEFLAYRPEIFPNLSEQNYKAK